ncbi:glycoside hydrolase (plasmid) [Bacillus mycoides]|uniref:bifunctional lytic transglycosylase/C40 family peptidase n=1 Tax=Bacillus mycoides TaxID=1405 RepID=UPI001C02E4EA|nr:lysozyme family protein [Bacillus mycoides]QWH76038.1 glycoside hydrolase [Bacillus mycoides]QWI47430.1 glycoside hydrolase [Bacillus mycoides]
MYIKATVTVVRNWKPILIGILVLFSLFICLMWGGGSKPQTPMGTGTTTVPPEVLKWEPTVRKYAQEFGVEPYVPLMLSLIMQESGGRLLDVMQSAEGAFNTKYPKIQNGITDPDYSIWAGVQEFKHSITIANVQGPSDINRIKLALQTYNFGPGFLNYINSNGGEYTLELAKSFALKMANGRTGCGFRSPYCYGDYSYVEKVLKYYQTSEIAGGGAVGDEFFQKVMAEAIKYKGYKYVFGGASPTASFDCSGLTQWTFRTAGVQLDRTAQMQWNQTKRISAQEAKPGDLVFFHGTYNSGTYITHVGIYQGNMQMYHAGDPLDYADLNKPYWQQHLAGFGRVQ